jgi:hypothetical protein
MTKSNTKQTKYWEEKVNEYKKSGIGISQSKWCKENNLSLRSFNYWYCKFKKIDKENKENDANCSKKDEDEDNQTKWIPIIIQEKDEDENKNKVGIVISIGKAKIEINKGFDAQSLYEVVKVVNLLC